MATAHRKTGGGQNKSDKVLTPAEAYEDFFTIPCPPDAKTCSELQAELGKSRKPVFLKRGMSAGYNDLLMSAEYILSEGNPNVVLCERGVKTFITGTRNTLDLNAVPYLKSKTHLPVVVDPSHGTGIREMVLPMSKAALAAGADGLMVEMHPHPDQALSDGMQSLFPEQFEKLMEVIRRYAELEGRVLP